ncbi:hypothetical protein HMPREF0591_5116 [Mycobacterium parascrofulaceum ATCC BAA-614]|uniref:Uncharacterized protein n=1 Tax=Mycobacterium parascrofulaceum ATCC BAA-614 TaxID=525368 RepID=D5PG22_9MYCO|nr:hypothetical protein HMPREF0591_5116 [Mycobacterium parascrofulaceum ATCC BAA-614]
MRTRHAISTFRRRCCRAPDPAALRTQGVRPGQVRQQLSACQPGQRAPVGLWAQSRPFPGICETRTATRRPPRHVRLHALPAGGAEPSAGTVGHRH